MKSAEEADTALARRIPHSIRRSWVGVGLRNVRNVAGMVSIKPKSRIHWCGGSRRSGTRRFRYRWKRTTGKTDNTPKKGGGSRHADRSTVNHRGA